MAERMTEERVAELEATLREAERQANLEQLQGEMFHGAGLAAMARKGSNPAVAVAEKAYLAGRAQLEQEKRAAADEATANIVAANQRMAHASEAAARSSAESALASRRSATWTFAAAVVAAGAVVIQAWQAWQSHPRPPPALTVDGAKK